MLKINDPLANTNYSDRLSSYGIITNDKGQLLVVEIVNWGLIFVGGKIEIEEDSRETIKRESLEEIGYEIKEIDFYVKVESYYDTSVKGEIIHCHNIADFYIGKVSKKVQDPVETNTKLHWYYPNELVGKLKLEFQNVILEKAILEKLI